MKVGEELQLFREVIAKFVIEIKLLQLAQSNECKLDYSTS
jgi:hypothetical protein